MNDFGTYLRELRGNRSLRELSKLTRISHTYLSTLEKGYDPRTNKPRKPSADTIQKLSATLGVEPFEMFKKAGLLYDKTISNINQVNVQKESDLDTNTHLDIKFLSEIKKENRITLEELFNPYSNYLLKFKGKLITSQEKQKILKLLEELFNQ